MRTIPLFVVVASTWATGCAAPAATSNPAADRKDAAVEAETKGCPDRDPNSGGPDGQLYAQALVAFEGGDQAEAVKKFWELIKRHPASQHMSVAWLQLGEHFLASGKNAQATKAFQKAAETRKPLIYSLATIRLIDLGAQEADRTATASRCLDSLAKKNCWANRALLDAWREICSAPDGGSGE